MWPIIFSIGPITLYSYGLSLAIAVVVCSLLLARDAKAKGLKPQVAQDLMFYIVLGGICGARLFYVYLGWGYYHDHLIEILFLNQGGLAWQGGFVGAVVTGFIFARAKSISMPLLFDLAAPYIALGQAIGRLGCFANGCCYGKPVAWGIYFPSHGARLHPTQLYEAGSLLLIFFILKYLSNKGFKPGMIFVAYLGLSSIERFTVEFYRADQMSVIGPLSLFQWISLGIFIIALGLFIMQSKGPSRGR